ncbi:MAG: hypothetical protein ABMA64_18980 [Myxococcota bacterium]
MPLSLPCWVRIRRSTRRRLARVANLLLCALLVFGLLPGSDEVVETIAHLVHDGHLPHSDTHEEVAATEDCGDADEHGCTPLDHHCKCCPSISAVPSHGARPEALVLSACSEQGLANNDRGPPTAGVKPPLRPPIT